MVRNVRHTNFTPKIFYFYPHNGLNFYLSCHIPYFRTKNSLILILDSSRLRLFRPTCLETSHRRGEWIMERDPSTFPTRKPDRTSIKITAGGKPVENTATDTHQPRSGLSSTVRRTAWNRPYFSYVVNFDHWKTNILNEKRYDKTHLIQKGRPVEYWPTVSCNV